MIAMLAGLALAAPELGVTVELPMARTQQLQWWSWMGGDAQPRRLGLGLAGDARLYGPVVLGTAVRTQQRAWDTNPSLQAAITQADLTVSLRTKGLVQVGGGFGGQLAHYTARYLDRATTIAPLIVADLGVSLVPKGAVRPMVTLHAAAAPRFDWFSASIVDPTRPWTAEYMPGNVFLGVRLGVQWGGEPSAPTAEAVVEE